MTERNNDNNEIYSLLDRNDKGQVKSNLNNCTTVLRHDPVLEGAFRRNLLTDMTDIVKPMPWNQRSSSITDTDVNNIRLYLEQKYEI